MPLARTPSLISYLPCAIIELVGSAEPPAEVLGRMSSSFIEQFS